MNKYQKKPVKVKIIRKIIPFATEKDYQKNDEMKEKTPNRKRLLYDNKETSDDYGLYYNTRNSTTASSSKNCRRRIIKIPLETDQYKSINKANECDCLYYSKENNSIDNSKECIITYDQFKKGIQINNSLNTNKDGFLVTLLELCKDKTIFKEKLTNYESFFDDEDNYLHLFDSKKNQSNKSKTIQIDDCNKTMIIDKTFLLYPGDLINCRL